MCVKPTQLLTVNKSLCTGQNFFFTIKKYQLHPVTLGILVRMPKHKLEKGGSVNGDT